MNAKKALAAFLAMTMFASMATSAFAATNFNPIGDIDSDAGLTSPIISFTVPAAISVKLDQYQLTDDTGSQIVSGKIDITNESNIPISVSVKAKVTPKAASNVKLVSTAAAALATATDDVEKRAFVTAVPVNTVKLGDKNTTDVFALGVDGTAPVYGLDYAYADKVFNSTTATGRMTLTDRINGELIFGLGAATYIMNTAGDAKDVLQMLGTPTPSGASGVAAKGDVTNGATTYRYMGALNANAAWAAQDIKVTTTFAVSGMTKDAFKAIKPVAGVANVASATNNTFGPYLKAAVTAVPENTDLEIVFDAGKDADAATKIMSIKAGTATLLAGTDWEVAAVDAADNTMKLTIKAAAVGKIDGTVVSKIIDKDLVVTFDKGNPKTLTIKMPAALS